MFIQEYDSDYYLVNMEISTRTESKITEKEGKQRNNI